MAFGAYVQSIGKVEAAVTSSSLAFGSNNTAGNSILVTVLVPAEGRTVTVTDSRNTYAQDAMRQYHGITTEQFIFRASNIGAGANTVNVAISGGALTLRYTISEFEGNASLDQTASTDFGASGGSNIQPKSGATGTTTDANELIYGACGCDGQTFGISAGSGFSNATVDDTAFAAQFVCSESKVVSGTGTQEAVFDLNPAQGRNWICLVNTYKSAAAAGRTTKNTRVSPLGIEIGMGWRMDL